MDLFGDSVLLGFLVIFTLRVIDVSLGTVRMIMTIRNLRVWAMVIGFVEITIWVVAVSQVISNLDSIWKVLAYSGGFTVGTLVGMLLEDRMALGDVAVYVISRAHSVEITRQVRESDYGVTELPAYGKSGPVDMLVIVTPRKRLRRLLNLIRQIDDDAFVTVQDKRIVFHGYGLVAK